MTTRYADRPTRPDAQDSLPAASSASGPAPGAPAALLITRDQELVESVRRLAGAAGTTLDVRGGRPGRDTWTEAGTVLVGLDLAAEISDLLPRRGGVLLVGQGAAWATTGRSDVDAYELALSLGAERVALLPHGQEWVVQALAESWGPGPRCTVVGMVGGCGGAGASVLAAAVAVGAARRGRRALLADLDPLGGGVDLLVGAEQVHGLRWPDLARARGRIGAGMLREALPRVDDLSVLSWDRGDLTAVPAEAAAAVAAGAVRGFDLVVTDLPRAPDPAAQAWLRLVDVVFLVVPASVRALAAGGRVLAALDTVVPDIRLVARGPAPAGLPAELMAESLGVPLFAELRAEPGLDGLLSRAEAPGLRPRGPLTRCARRVLDSLDRFERVA